MSALSGIEQATGQSFPPLFKQLHAAGRLSWGAPHPEWSEVVFPTLQADPPVLLYAQTTSRWNTTSCWRRGRS